MRYAFPETTGQSGGTRNSTKPAVVVVRIQVNAGSVTDTLARSTSRYTNSALTGFSASTRIAARAAMVGVDLSVDTTVIAVGESRRTDQQTRSVVTDVAGGADIAAGSTMVGVGIGVHTGTAALGLAGGTFRDGTIRSRPAWITHAGSICIALALTKTIQERIAARRNRTIHATPTRIAGTGAVTLTDSVIGTVVRAGYGNFTCAGVTGFVGRTGIAAGTAVGVVIIQIDTGAVTVGLVARTHLTTGDTLIKHVVALTRGNITGIRCTPIPIVTIDRNPRTGAIKQAGIIAGTGITVITSCVGNTGVGIVFTRTVDTELSGATRTATGSAVVGIVIQVGFAIDIVPVTVCGSIGTNYRTAFIRLAITVVVHAVADFQGPRMDGWVVVVTVDRGTASVLREEAVVIAVTTFRTTAFSVIDLTVTIVVNAVAHFLGNGIDIRVVIVTIDGLIIVVVIGIDTVFNGAEFGLLVFADLDIDQSGDDMVVLDECEAIGPRRHITQGEFSCWGQESGKGMAHHINQDSRGVAATADKGTVNLTRKMGVVQVGKVVVMVMAMVAVMLFMMMFLFMVVTIFPMVGFLVMMAFVLIIVL